MAQIYSVILDITPYIGSGLGEYNWSDTVGACIPIWVGHSDYVIFFSTLAIIPFGIIIVTSVWTFLFTRGFIRKHYQMNKDTLDKDFQKSVYNIRIRNLIGVFGESVLAGNLVTRTN